VPCDTIEVSGSVAGWMLQPLLSATDGVADDNVYGLCFRSSGTALESQQAAELSCWGVLDGAAPTAASLQLASAIADRVEIEVAVVDDLTIAFTVPSAGGPACLNVQVGPPAIVLVVPGCDPQTASRFVVEHAQYLFTWK
jgi:hypothetical protein